MKLNSSHLNELCNIAIHAAEEAGELIRAYSSKKLIVNNKADGLAANSTNKTGTSIASQVVTEVDYLSQEIILKHLLPTIKEFNLGLLTEESTDERDRLRKDYFWCVDPLDGTLPFTESTSGYAVSIALVSKLGKPLIGVVFDPLGQKLYHAVNGAGVFINKAPWRLTEKKDRIKTFCFVADRSFLEHKKFEFIEKEVKKIALGEGCTDVKIIKHGGAVMNSLWVLEKQPACYFKFPKPECGGGSLWDYAATTCVYNEFGAIATNIYGGSLDLNRADSSFMNHQGVLYTSNSRIARQIVSLYKKIK